MPIMSGTLGPYTSASISPVLCPSRAREMARFTETVVLPTPPFPEPTAIRFFTPGIGSLGICPGWFGLIVKDYGNAFGYQDPTGAPAGNPVLAPRRGYAAPRWCNTPPTPYST